MKGSAAGAGLASVTDRAGDSLSISFEGSEIDLVVGTGPEGGIVSVTVDGAEANLLPSDRQGQSYLDLYNDRPADGVVVPVGSSLASGKHVLNLSVSGNRNPASKGSRASIEGFSVRQTERSYTWTFISLVSGTLLGGLILLYAWLRRRPRDERSRP